MAYPTGIKRPLPAVTPENETYWHGGAHGELRLPRCRQCDALLHPSQTVCPSCHEAALEWIAVSGRAHLVGFTINEQEWHPGFPPPYLIGIVALDDDPSVRLTTNIVNCKPDDVQMRMPLQVSFEQVDEVWLPVFEPADGPSDGPVPAPPKVTARPMVSTEKFENRVAITGIGVSDIGRRLMRPPIAMTVQACEAAVADAGLEMADIDGLATYPGGGLSGGITEGGIAPVEEALRIHPTWHQGGLDTPGQGGSIAAAMLAVASGLCRHVLCFRTVWEATNTELLRTGKLPLPSGGRIQGDFQYRIPYGAMSPANWIAMYASQYFHQFGADRTVLGRIAINARANAARNPEAIYREPMTMDDYLSARTISTPFGLYDCDVPCDGAVAIIVSARDAAADLRQPPVHVEAVGMQIAERVSWDQGTITHLPGTFGPGAHLWSRTDLTPADVDVAELYDGFSFNCLSWLEALGFCGVGETQDFIGDGGRIALDGDLPLNTHGGQLSAGRTHGYGFFREAVLQLRGQAGDRQVPGAQVAVVSNGGGVPGGCFLFTRG